MFAHQADSDGRRIVGLAVYFEARVVPSTLLEKKNRGLVLDGKSAEHGGVSRFAILAMTPI